MPRRYLFGPVLAEYADQNLRSPRRDGQCLAFNQAGTADLALAPTESWESICARLPTGWLPDFLVLKLSYGTVPTGLWSAPLPLVGLAEDWNLLWHGYRHNLHRCDLVLTDTVGVEVMRKEGMDHARWANLYGCGHAYLQAPASEHERDIDILFVGNMNPAVQRERLPWLMRLARLGERWNVVLRSGVYGAAYRELLGRTRIAFNRSIRGECNQRTFEATAMGALLFQEEGNWEVPQYFRDRLECISYDEQNLEELLEYYLGHEEERRALAEAGRARVQQFGFTSLWNEALALIDREWPALEQRAKIRISRAEEDSLPARFWQALSSREADPTLVADLAVAAASNSRPAAQHNALGVLLGLTWTEGMARAVDQFRRAAQSDATFLLPVLNLAEALAHSDQMEEAVLHARRALCLLNQSSTLAPADLDGGHFLVAFDHFRVEWERTAWANAGRRGAEAEAKRTLLRWRLHALLAAWTGELTHAHEAVLARPDLPATRAALGTALLKANQPLEALPHLRAAVAGNPLDREAAAHLFQALGACGAPFMQLHLAHDRRMLTAAAPESVPNEPWFQDLPRPDDLLTSIIILCHNQLPLTQTCLASLLRHTQTPYELIVVDNASTDGTTEFLEGVRTQPEPPRVEVIRNESNLGFPAGCNRAAARARGCFLLFLNNDTVVTEGWLEGLLACALHNWPTIGMVGPMTNHTGNDQQIPIDYAEDLGGLDTFALRRRQAFAGRAHEPPMLCGFCLLIRRDLFDQVDGFDERFGLGYLDDDDLSLKVKRAGYRLLAAHNVFVHHVGGCTFATLGIDGAQQRVSNFAKFRAKWGDEHLGDYHMTSAPSPTDSGSLPKEGTRASPRTAVTMLWEGPFLTTHSLALVNRELCRRLLARGQALTLLPTDSLEVEVASDLSDPLLRAHMQGNLPRAPDVHVRHRWPPDFAPPPAGYWVMIQPWEYGSLPKEWIGPMATLVDELWVPSRYVRDCYVTCGISPDRVHVVPNGVDAARFHPQAPPRALRTKKRFKFLFVGGTIARKGIDLLLTAYLQAFTADDDVCLVIKDMGVRTVYQGQTAGDQIRQCQSQPGAPEIEYVDQSLPGADLAGLYTACDCLVHPYRGEGFGLPVAEAMACGLPVIVTGYGAALDFCSEATAYLIPAKVVRFPDKCLGELETVDYPWLAEPDLETLVNYLRRVVECPVEARAKGFAASRHMRAQFTWDRAAVLVEQRLEALRRRPIRRFENGQALAAESGPSAAAESEVVGEPAPSDSALASIITLCCNEVEYTRLCVESLLRHTRPPYELVLVDNGSTDDTPAYLQSLHSLPGPNRVKVIRNETNRGIPAGYNQALAAAEGRFVVFLNKDTVVTDGWLDGLIAWTLREWPKIGLVGAVSNYVMQPQKVEVAYKNLAELETFAVRHRGDCAGQGLFVERLSAFCLLVRRDVFDRVGTFDERYGLGFFDDDDLCVRAREAGFHLLVARDVFVHHFGSRTFTGLGIDCRQQLTSNYELFRQKWGAERAAGYSLPPDGAEPEPVATERGTTPSPMALPRAGGEARLPTRGRVSLAMIVKNEERNLPTCLESVADLVDEIILVDTGSTDRTKDIAVRFGARVYDFAWIDHFAAARNESLRHVTGDWVLWLDADDFVDQENRQRLGQLFANLCDEQVAYVMKCLCLPEHDTGAATVVDHVRLFRYHPDLRWEYRVHEQILGALRRQGTEIRLADVVIHHTGYQDPAHRPRKVERDLRLLRLQDRETPDDPFVLFNLGSLCSELNRPAEALPLFRRSLKRSSPQDSIVRKLYALIALCHRQLGQPREALAACREGVHCCPGDIELLYTEARLLRELGDLPGAVARVEQILQAPPADYFASVDPGLRGYKARLLLGQVYRDQGRAAEAEAAWEAAVVEDPTFGPAWLELGQLYLTQERWSDFDLAVDKLTGQPQLAQEAVLLRARAGLARREFAAARRLLAEAIAREPMAIYPRQLLTHALLQEGSDWAAAEQALREVLALAPQHAEARSNLAVLLRQSGRGQEVTW